jgi:hypothetical protein
VNTSIVSYHYIDQLTNCRRLLKEQVQPKLSTLQLAAVTEQRAALHQRITKWQQIQTCYMPEVSMLRTNQCPEDGEVIFSEDIILYLPSACPEAVAVPRNLVDIEKRLRLAQAEDTLAELWRLLRVSSSLWQYKRTQVAPSQRAGTRARSLITQFKDKIDRCADRYHAAHQALIGLDPQGDWSRRLRALRAEHVKGPR